MSRSSYILHFQPACMLHSLTELFVLQIESLKVMKTILLIFVGLAALSQASYYRNFQTICPSTNNFDAEFPSIVDIVLPDSEPFFFTNATNFFRNVMKFNDREIKRVTEDALDFFITTFGVDFTNAQPNESGTRFSEELNATLFEYELNPALRYSITFNEWTVTGARRSYCLDNRDGGFIIIFGSDAILHGTYGGEEGILIKANERILYGFYNIPICKQSPLIIQYQSASPVRIDTFDGFATINCDLSNKELGPGIAQGLFRVTPLGDGNTRYNIRNLFTFPPHPGQRMRSRSFYQRQKQRYHYPY